MKKIDYGFDAPDFTRQAFLIGSALVLSGISLSYFFSTSLIKYVGWLIIFGGVCALITVLMLISYWFERQIQYTGHDARENKLARR